MTSSGTSCSPSRADRRRTASAGEQVEAYVVRSRDTDVKVFDGEVESLSVAEIDGVGVRVVVDGRQGYAWAGSLDPDVVADALAEARDNAGFGDARRVARPRDARRRGAVDRARPRPVARRARCRCRPPTRSRSRSRLERRRAPATRVSAASSRRRYGDAAVEAAVASSLGVEAVDPARRLLVSRRSRSPARATAPRPATASRPAAPSPISTSTRPRATPSSERSGCSARASPRSQRLPVVLDPLVTRSLLGDPRRGAQRRGGGEGPVDVPRPRRASRSRAANVTLVDDPTVPAAFGAAAHDAEGVPTRADALIVARRAPRLPAQHVHRPPRRRAGTTGSAVRGGFTSTPGVGARALHLEPGRAVARGDPRGERPERALRAVGERPALGHQPGERRLLGRRRRSDGARRRVRRAGPRGHDRVDAAAHAARRRGGRQRPHLAPRWRRGR